MEDKKQPFRNAMSISPFTEAMFRSGFIYEDGQGNTAVNALELQKLFVKHGASEVYVRIATARKHYSLESADHSLEAGIERAKLAARLGLPLNPEIGLFKYYGDVTGQPGPDFSEYPEIIVSKPWEQMTVDEMVPIVEKYAAIVAEELIATGVKINVWDIGNEVNFGIAGVAVQPLPNAIDNEMGANWYRAPDGVNPEIGKQDVYSFLTMDTCLLVHWMESNLWPFQAKLMNAVREGILTVDRDAKFSTHVTYAENTMFTTAFFKAMVKNGFNLDIAGVSYYPSSLVNPKGRLTDFKSTVSCLYHEMGLPVFIAEYAYPNYSDGAVLGGPYKDWNSKVGNYEMDIDGQEAFLRDLTSWGCLNGICGIRPWAPDLVVLWKEFSMFSLTGSTARALPVMDSISKGLESPSSEGLFE